jgi:transmembrane sensor
MENNLLSRIITGEASLEEKRDFYLRLSKSKEEEELFFKVKNLWLRSSMLESTIDVDAEYEVLLKRISNPSDRLDLPIWKNILKYAAIVLFILGIGGLSGYFISQNSTRNDLILSAGKSSDVINQEISTNFGARMKFQLPDGTTVHLNSGSKLIFPSNFNENYRKVQLRGEAFFEVTPDPDRPFTVQTNVINVKVLGTTFNLKAYPDSKEISTTLVSGKISLEKETAGIFKQIAILNPHERAVYNEENEMIEVSVQEDLDKFIAWKDGKLVFFNDPIDELAEKLGIWYNVTVKIGNKNLQKCRFTATFTDEPIEQVLDLLSKSSPIKYKVIKSSKLSDNSFSKRVIIFN